LDAEEEEEKIWQEADGWIVAMRIHNEKR